MTELLVETADGESTIDLGVAADEREPFAGFVEDEATREVAVQVAAELGWQLATIERGGVADCARTYGVLPPPRLLLVDLDEAEEPVADFKALREVVGAGTLLVAVGSVNDIALYRALAACGAADYLVKPIVPELLRAALERAEAPAEVKESTRQGRLVLVVGARGGIGASTVALNCAWLLANLHKQRVGLVDLDLQFGTLALALDLEPGHGLREALEAPERVDELFIDRAMVKAGEGLFLFGAEEPLDTAPDFQTAALLGLLDDLRARFDIVVADLPRAMLSERRDLLASAEEIVLVADLSLVALRDAIRIKRNIEEAAPETRLTIVSGRTGGRAAGQLSVKDFEKGLQGRLAHSIPFDEKLAAKSANIGQPMAQIAKRSKPALALRRLTEALLAERADPAKEKSAR